MYNGVQIEIRDRIQERISERGVSIRQRLGLGGMAALPPSVSQVPGKYLCFLVPRVNERNTIDSEHDVGTNEAAKFHGRKRDNGGLDAGL